MCKEMEYYCDVCDKTIKFKSKSKHLKSLTHNEYEKNIQQNRPLKILICLTQKKQLTNISLFILRKFDLYLVKFDFKLVFDKEIYPHNNSELQRILTIFHLKRFLLLFNEFFMQRGYKFFHIYEMCFTTICNKRYTIYEF